MKKKPTRPTSEERARWREADRLLAERVAVLDRKIAEGKKRRERRES